MVNNSQFSLRSTVDSVDSVTKSTKDSGISPLDTPLVFIIFNRPDKTRETFAAIAKARPKKLLVIADGPRRDRVGEEALCQEARQMINQVDWDCEVLKNYSEINLGCKNRVASGLDWVFDQVSEAIILEDDCLPNPDFFQFCSEMLNYYRDNERVGMISGDNFQNGIVRGDGDYYFSKYCHIWGWATWARAWKKYDVHLNEWPRLKDQGWLDSLGFGKLEKFFWTRAFDRVHSGAQDTWDYQWTFACWFHQMLAVMPNKNLISNIGFDLEATHTKGESIHANMTTSPLVFPLTHPARFEVNLEADLFSSKNMFACSPFKRIFSKLQAKLGILQ